MLWAILNSFYVYECGIITELSSKLPKALCVDGGQKERGQGKETYHFSEKVSIVVCAA